MIVLSYLVGRQCFAFMAICSLHASFVLGECLEIVCCLDIILCIALWFQIASAHCSSQWLAIFFRPHVRFVTSFVLAAVVEADHRRVGRVISAATVAKPVKGTDFTAQDHGFTMVSREQPQRPRPRPRPKPRSLHTPFYCSPSHQP